MRWGHEHKYTNFLHWDTMELLTWMKENKLTQFTNYGWQQYDMAQPQQPQQPQEGTQAFRSQSWLDVEC